MKKKILFMVINMNVGGTEKALLNMINEMPKHKCDITILMLERNGGFLESIPDGIHVEYIEGYSKIKNTLTKPSRNVTFKFLKEKMFIKALSFLMITILSKTFNNKNIFFRYLLKEIPSLKNEYDVAVAYAGPMDLISYFVTKKIKAEKKLQWIHFDVTKVG